MKRLLTAILLAAAIAIPQARAQDAKFTALFIVNFARYVEWPNTAGDFVIAVVGDDPVIEELQTVAGKTKVGEQSLVVVKTGSIEQLGTCNIVYVTPGRSAALAAAIARFGAAGVLIVTNGKGLAEHGAAINLAMIDGKQRYEINPESLKKSGLTAKPVLFKLGKVIGQ